MEPRKVSIKKLIDVIEQEVNGIFYQWKTLISYSIVELEDKSVDEAMFNKIKFLPPSPQVKLEWEETIIEDSFDAFVPGINEHVYIDKNYTGWKLTFDPLELSSEKLKAKTIEEAKAEAIEVIRKRISDLKKAFDNIIP